MRQALPILCLVCLAAPLPADPLDQALALDQQNNRASATAQNKIDGLDDERRDLLAEYLQIARRIELLRTDNQQLQIRVDAQQRHLESLNAQRDAAETTRLGILPLMEQMQHCSNYISGEVLLKIPVQQMGLHQ